MRLVVQNRQTLEIMKDEPLLPWDSEESAEQFYARCAKWCIVLALLAALGLIAAQAASVLKTVNAEQIKF